MPQLNYSLFQQPGQEGQIATADSDGTLGTFRECFNSLSAYIPFGRVVVQSPTAPRGGLQLPTATAATQPPLGISYIMPYEKDIDGNSGIPAKRPMGYLYRGVIWMKAESAVTAGANVFYRFAAGAGGTELGAVRADADTATAAQLPRAKFERSAAAGQIVAVRVDIDQV